MKRLVRIVLVCGDRNWRNPEPIQHELLALKRAGAAVLVHGAARGADSLAADIGARLGFVVRAFPADWKSFGRAAGPIRNARMLAEGHPDLVLAFHDNIAQSRGTADMVRRARNAGVPTRIVRSS